MTPMIMPDISSDSKSLSPLAPIPPPGVAILSAYITKSPISINFNVKKSTASIDGRPIFLLRKDSNAAYFVDATTNNSLFRISKLDTWCAEINGNKLLDSSWHQSMIGGDGTAHFINMADPARSQMTLDYHSSGSSKYHEMKCNGHVVAVVEQKNSMMSDPVYHVAAGMGPTLVIAFHRAMRIEVETKDANALRVVKPILSIVSALSGVSAGGK